MQTPTNQKPDEAKVIEAEVPMGIVHPFMLEPFRVRFFVDDEIVTDCEITLDPAHRGIERIMEGLPIERANIITERICGICGNIHLWNSVKVVEEGLGIEIPERASYIRVITEELERIHSHLIFFGHAFEVLGHETFCYRFFKLREPIMDCLYWLSGGRVHYSVPILGGVRPRTDITPWKRGKILPVLNELEVELKKFVDRILADPMIMSRIAGVGILSKEDADRLHAVGPTARASGIDWDWRRHTRDYDRFDFKIIVLEAGDTAARIVARLLETFECIKMVRQGLNEIPSQGPLVNTDWQLGKMDFNHSYIEAPRGEVYHSVSLDSRGWVRHYKIRTPSLTNISSMEFACIGDQLTDAVVTIASCDPCLACTNRVIVVEKGKEQVIEVRDLVRDRV